MNELGCLRRRACGRPWSLWLCAVAMKLDGVRKDYRSAAYTMVDGVTIRRCYLHWATLVYEVSFTEYVEKPETKATRGILKDELPTISISNFATNYLPVHYGVPHVRLLQSVAPHYAAPPGLHHHNS
eukprot:1179391-Prorocentrum_minimum.AAC.5